MRAEFPRPSMCCRSCLSVSLRFLLKLLSWESGAPEGGGPGCGLGTDTGETWPTACPLLDGCDGHVVEPVNRNGQRAAVAVLLGRLGGRGYPEYPSDPEPMGAGRLRPKAAYTTGGGERLPSCMPPFCVQAPDAPPTGRIRGLLCYPGIAGWCRISPVEERLSGGA